VLFLRPSLNSGTVPRLVVQPLASIPSPIHHLPVVLLSGVECVIAWPKLPNPFLPWNLPISITSKWFYGVGWLLDSKGFGRRCKTVQNSVIPRGDYFIAIKYRIKLIIDYTNTKYIGLLSKSKRWHCTDTGISINNYIFGSGLTFRRNMSPISSVLKSRSTLNGLQVDMSPKNVPLHNYRCENV
jgi:hypothetical protein